MVPREHIILNTGKRPKHCSGLPNKLYHKHDYVEPLVDSMKLMYHRLGWSCLLVEQEDSGCVPLRRAVSTDEQLHTLGFGPAPSTAPTPLCQGCGTTNRNDLTQTADRSHMVCKCGIVCAPVRISQDREKNCAREDDKTIHADKPYQPKTDRFDHPAKSCEELRKDREREAQVTRIGKKAKQKMGIGWAHEHAAREAARAERSRQEMEPKDQTKGHHIQIELEKLFTQFEPIDAPIKRFCRMAADRAWRRAVAHSKVCNARGRCQLRVKEKGPAVIADAVLSCSLNTLINDRVPLDGIQRPGLLCLADKIGALQNTKGTSCALRAVRTVVGTLLSQNIGDPIEPCPMPSCHASCQPSPAPSSSSDASAQQPLPSGHPPFQRADSSVSDVPQRTFAAARFRQQSIQGVGYLDAKQRAGTLRAIQDPLFRAALAVAREENADVKGLSQNGLSYVFLVAVATQAEQQTGISHPRRVPPRLLSDFASSTAQLDAAAQSIRALLPDGLNAFPVADEGDGLFG